MEFVVMSMGGKIVEEVDQATHVITDRDPN